MVANVKQTHALIIFTLLSGAAQAYQAPEPEFRPVYIGEKDLTEYVNDIYANDFKRWQEPPTGYLIKNESRSLKTQSNELIITHFYLVGKGWSDNKFESFQFIAAHIRGSKHIIFQSGLYMPECEGASWEINKFAFSESSHKGIYRLSAKRTLHGCSSAEEYDTSYTAVYNVNQNTLEEVTQHMKWKP